ncbi:MAG: hypothetical protein DID91_2727702307 [Candidatus Nitrotoga sp. MKT]|nr:MAG: hypothetical protein DID91_2727702307 [Candidatus Nitrotoga sp. MKT]
MKFDSIKRTLNGLLVALTIFMASPTAMAFVADTTALNGSLTGLWNNADQPGWGAAITHQYGMIFATFYTYNNAGNPTWYVASACPVSGSGCTGPLYTVTGGTNPIDVWNAPNKVVTQVGTVAFTFTDANTGTMSYSINGSNGVKTITKSVFASPPIGGGTGEINGSLNGSLTGLWNNADQPGWGAAVTHQYGMIFATFYTYDNAGSPTWYVASACPVSGSGCTGPLYTVTGGTNPIDVWNAPNKVVTQVGTMTFTFTDANTGTMSYSINGLNGVKTIIKSVFASPPTGRVTGGANGSLTITGSSSEPGTFLPASKAHDVEDNLNGTSMSWSDLLSERELFVYTSNLSNAPGALVLFLNYRNPTNFHACWFGTFPNSSEFTGSHASFGDCNGITIDHNSRMVTFSNVKLGLGDDGPEPPGSLITLNGKLLY